MGKRKQSDRIRLSLPESLLIQVERLVEFQDLPARIFPNEAEDLKSCAGCIKWAVHLYISACEVGIAGECPIDLARVDTRAVQISRTGQEVGDWRYAIQSHFASSDSDLATKGLYRYFNHMQQQSMGDAAIASMLLDVPPHHLISQIRRGELNNV